ncbi:MAG: aldo/keto reductase [Bacteroidetes bacterium]|jgi:aryl-alcohol dehydrogenase-like predicted oxidoreductase|nr:aldo/keto reductase [Bacteroidota bacterium]
MMAKKASKIALGTVQFGTDYGVSNREGQTDAREVEHILDTAMEFGIDLIDTASAYGNAEQVLGSYDLSSFKVVSKFMPPSGGATIADQLRTTLSNLRVDSLYGYLAHRPDDLLENEEQWQELVSLKYDGRVEKIGFSLDAPLQLKQLLSRDYMPDIVQVPYNFLDRRFYSSLNELKMLGCEIHARSVFLQGLLLMAPEEVEEYYKPVKPTLVELQKLGAQRPSALLDFVLSTHMIDRAVIGVENSEQLRQNLNGTGTRDLLPKLESDIPEEFLMPKMWPIS